MRLVFANKTIDIWICLNMWLFTFCACVKESECLRGHIWPSKRVVGVFSTICVESSFNYLTTKNEVLGGSYRLLY